MIIISFILMFGSVKVIMSDSNNDIDMKIGSLQNEDEIKSFLIVDNEELNKQLINIGFTTDGSGDTTEWTSESITSRITSSTTSSIITALSQDSTFLIQLDCATANYTLTSILEQFNKTFTEWCDVTHNGTSLHCRKSLPTTVSLIFITNSSITTLNNLFKTLHQIVSKMGITLLSVDKCGTNGIVTVSNVTSCYLIDLCNLCGTNPRRGICLPENNLSKCECFANQDDPSISYIGEFCLQQKIEPITSTPSWTLIIIGILASITLLFCIIICYALIICYSRHRTRKRNKNKIQIIPEWHLPRAQIPSTVLSTSITDENRLPITRNYDPIDELDAIIDNDRTEILTFRRINFNSQ